ncbi:MAG TPA: hypothetical protein VFN95_19140, partial [Flavitalea sp.]|nr:hypothetical protein [Flavitalea sp.]
HLSIKLLIIPNTRSPDVSTSGLSILDPYEDVFRLLTRAYWRFFSTTRNEGSLLSSGYQYYSKEHCIEQRKCDGSKNAWG